MEAILVLLALMFLVWKIKRANDEAFDSGQQMSTKSSFYEDTQSTWDSGSTYASYSSIHHDDDCDVLRASWDPSCHLYHSSSDYGYIQDCGSSTDYYSSCNSWDSSSWDSSSSSSSSWD